MKAVTDLRQKVFTTVDQAEVLRMQLTESAIKTVSWLKSCHGEPMAMLKALRFELVGSNPLTGRPLNVVEQLNQTFTILVTLKAIEKLIELHPEATDGFRLALGTSSGRDIESAAPNYVAAEVFAATNPNNNQKLAKDTARLAADGAQHRYVFFAAPKYEAGRIKTLEKHSRVHVYAVSL